MVPGVNNNRTASFSFNDFQGSSFGINVVQVAENDNSAQSCIGVDTSFVTLRPLPVTLNKTWTWRSVEDNKVTAIPLAMPSMDIPISVQYFCRSNIPGPSFDIVGPTAICKPATKYTYRITTNNKGYKPVQWSMDPSFYESFQVINDSTIDITFKDAATGPYQAALYAQGGDCTIAKDTLLIDVVPGPALPRFVNICTQPVELDPGNWFTSYRWQDGSANQKYTITQPGRYMVQVTTPCNEIITDTVDAFDNKTGQLPNAASICKNDTLLLQAPAGFTNYSWGPGYNDKDIYVYPEKDTFYVLSSTTIDGCQLKDTVYVGIIQPRPVHLGTDTFVCVQEDLVLNAGSGFTSYAWNTGVASPTLTVTAPGTYSVVVTDVNGCVARDTVLVTSKVCPKRFHVPNAFSPNGDGKNEVFKPHIEGRLDKFEMTIYNRWGGVVYRTNNAAAGWNGNVNGYLQNTGAYMWVCRYRFSNEVERVEKGVVVLVR
jgi:gliding motility-associated-like protein